MKTVDDLSVAPAGMPHRGLDGEYDESQLPLLLTRRGMAEWIDGAVRILDRRRLPATTSYITCGSVEDVANAIETMTIQGAFTLSLAAGYGGALAAPAAAALSDGTLSCVGAGTRRLAATRPTGLALQLMLAEARRAAASANARGEDVASAIVRVVDTAAGTLARQALATARHALPLFDDGNAILTHCFADRSL